MVEAILPDIYAISVPLPRNPLKAVNCYVIAGHDRWLIVDTGMNRQECRAALQAGLEQLGVKPEKTDLFLTHMHADHSGLAGMLHTGTSRVFCSKTDGTIINLMGVSEEHWFKMQHFACRNGFPAAEAELAVTNHPGRKFSNRDKLLFSAVRQGDVLKIGRYEFVCVETPGHTPGHVCLYESTRKILFSGDHVLEDITPNITLMREEDNPLEDYLASLDKIAAFGVSLVLPGHRRTFADLKARVNELKEHHFERMKEILDILCGGPLTAYDIAAMMKWDLTHSEWALFPPQQKWFAHGEALAHLKYLEAANVITKEMRQGQWFYSMSSLARETALLRLHTGQNATACGS